MLQQFPDKAFPVHMYKSTFDDLICILDMSGETSPAHRQNMPNTERVQQIENKSLLLTFKLFRSVAKTS